MQCFDENAWFLLFWHPLKLYMVLYSTGTVFFHCSIISWGLGQNVRLPCFHTYEKERESTLQMYNVVYIHFIITLFNVGNVLLYVIYQLNFTVCMLHEYHVRYYLRFHVTAGGVGTYYPRIQGSACNLLSARHQGKRSCIKMNDYASMVFVTTEYQDHK